MQGHRKNIVITAGGTTEKIDNVRYITNMSTGKLGATICDTILAQNSTEVEKIYYIYATKSVMPVAHKKVELISVTGAYDLKEKVETLLSRVKIDFFIHSMAVSDYTTDYVSGTKRLSEEITNKIWDFRQNIFKAELTELVSKVLESPDNIIDTSNKMSSEQSEIIIKLKQTPKVISIIKDIQPQTVLIGFKLLSGVTEEELIAVASNLLVKNKCDYVVANDLVNIKDGEHKAVILDKFGNKTHVNGKDVIAVGIAEICAGDPCGRPVGR